MEFSLSVIFSHLYADLGKFSRFLLLTIVRKRFMTMLLRNINYRYMSCQLTIEFIALLNDIACVILSIARLFLC